MRILAEQKWIDAVNVLHHITILKCGTNLVGRAKQFNDVIGSITYFDR